MYSLDEIVKILKKEGFDYKINNKQDISPTHLKHHTEIDRNCLSFFTEKDAKLLNSSVQYVLICGSDTINVPSNITYITTSEPKAVFYRIAQMYKKHSRLSGIHPSSVISSDAKVHPSAYVGPFCYIENCEINADVVLVSNITIYSNTTIGLGTIVNSNTTIGVDGTMWAWGPNNKKIYMPSFRNTFIGDKSIIGANVTIARGSLDDTIIENECNIGHGSKIGHDCKIGKKTHLANGVALAGGVSLGKRCFIGSGACFKPSVKITNDIVVGIGSVVTKNCDKVESVLFGNPATELSPLNIFSKLSGLPKYKK